MDRSFLRPEQSPESVDLSSAVVALGSSLALEVVAEGIELDEQLNRLRDLGCELGQGFHFAHPMESERMLDYLAGSVAEPALYRVRRPQAPPGSHPSEPAPASPDAAYGNRDFRLLFTGRCVSLLGDGAFLVALAWQAYTISRRPHGTVADRHRDGAPLIALLLLGGVVSDRYDRRRVMLAADALRAVLLALIGRWR